MTREEFLSFLEPTLGIDAGTLKEDTNILQSGYMDSLASILIIEKIDEELGCEVNVSELKAAETVRDLIDCIGADRFE